MDRKQLQLSISDYELLLLTEILPKVYISLQDLQLSNSFEVSNEVAEKSTKTILIFQFETGLSMIFLNNLFSRFSHSLKFSQIYIYVYMLTAAGKDLGSSGMIHEIKRESLDKRLKKRMKDEECM